MNSRIGRIVGLILKALLAVVVIAVLAMIGFGLVMEYGKPARPPGAPPIGYENRLKYERGHISNFSGFDNIPVDLWFGKHDGQYDTTRFRVASDYFSKIPFWHGQYATLHVVWPSLHSIDEENEIRKKNGLQPVKEKEVFVMTFKETRSGWGTDKNGTEPTTRCVPMISDDERGVIYCNENRLDDNPGERWTNYWPLDESIRTPWYNNPPRFGCYVVNRSDADRYNRCDSHFSYNADVHIRIDTHETLAVEIVTNFNKLTEFLHNLEVKS